MQTNSQHARHTCPLLNTSLKETKGRVIISWAQRKCYPVDTSVKMVRLVLGSELITPNKTLSPFCNFRDVDIKHGRHSTDPK